MAQNRKFRDIEKDIEELAPITNRAGFEAAVPLLVELTEKIAAVRKTLSRTSKVEAKLNDACSAYALNHQSVFANGLVADGKDVRRGKVAIGEDAYNFVAGYGNPIRMDGGNLTQGFLGGLPNGWTKLTRDIDLTAINRAGITDEELNAQGLVRKAKNVWSHCDDDGDAKE